MKENMEKTTPVMTNIETFLKEVHRLQQYTAYKSKQDFFLDTRSEKVDLIIPALIEFVTNLPKLVAEKSVMGRYKYQGLPAMLDAINPVLGKYKCKCSQPSHSIDGRTYVVTEVYHESGQYLRSVTLLPEATVKAGKVTKLSEDMQAAGGAQTYIKRYALKGILGIDADEDTDLAENYVQKNNYQR